jgi:hypothetical protein
MVLWAKSGSKAPRCFDLISEFDQLLLRDHDLKDMCEPPEPQVASLQSLFREISPQPFWAFHHAGGMLP